MKSNNQRTTGLKVKAGVKAGGVYVNHNRRALAIRVQSGVKGGNGHLAMNHNRTML